MKITTLALTLGLLCLPVYAQDIEERYDSDCRPLKVEGKHGPFDYRKASTAERDLVERVHFNEHYQAYRMGKRKFQKVYDHIIEAPASGFGYTLWAFPNHHRSLAAVEDLAIKQKNDKVEGMGGMRAHCWFQRAVKFTPDDALVRSLYGYYYARRNMAKDAQIQLERAVELDPANVNVLTYVATAYLEINDLDRAVEYARKTYAAGYPLPGLRSRIEKAGRSLD